MDVQILKSLMKCSLIEEEAKPVVLKEEDLIDGVVECEASAYDKIQALKLGSGDLKEEFYSKEVASKLSTSFVECEVMELRKDKGEKKFFRAKVILNVTQPIRRLVNFQVGEVIGAGYLA
ncbi:hypothetical protein LIER_42814 [Lithospermum erythrorhizon]|uniref:Uncharacterized protein n=1 Tax=Lithospermum erythrorhizon TaxID=34254 RepID=A0AAV3P066_LITER